MSTTTHRLTAAAVAVAVLLGPVALTRSAEAAPGSGHSVGRHQATPHDGKHDKHDTKGKHGKGKGRQERATPLARQLAKAVAVKGAYLAKVAASRRTAALPDDLESVVVASIAGDRASLARLGASTDLRAARAAVSALRVESYVQVVGLLEKAVDLAEAAADDPEATALLRSAVGAALAVTATSPRSDLRAARRALDAACEALDYDDEPDTEDEPEDEPEDEDVPEDEDEPLD